MGRPGLTRHRKFARLERALDVVQVGFGAVLARGSLELLWDTAYENGDELLGDADDVENAARWRGERGLLAKALLEAGGAEEDGFTELRCACGEGRLGHRAGKACGAWKPVDGRFYVHDLWDHAPEYVAGRREREQERRKVKVCGHAGCGREFHSPDKRAKHCSHACRTAAYRDRNVGDVTDACAPVRHDAPPETGASVTEGKPTAAGPSGDAPVTEACAPVRHGDAGSADGDTPPAPSTQHPAPAPSTPSACSPASSGPSRASAPDGQREGQRRGVVLGPLGAVLVREVARGLGHGLVPLASSDDATALERAVAAHGGTARATAYVAATCRAREPELDPQSVKLVLEILAETAPASARAEVA
jgi:hypothetical protein